MSLHIADGLDLPDDAVTQTFAILAMRGRGKSYCASVMAEEMIDAGLPVVVVDPVGVWWGLRSSADGNGPGLPVVIFGGDHGDVPLEPTAGRLIADLIVEGHVTCVLDLSRFDSKADEIRFMTDFLIRLYRTNRHPLHVILDEADEFAPQQAFPEGKRLLHAVEQIVRRGRARGLGCTLITQRPAVLNKNVLSQSETLILLGMTGVTDLRAVDAWVGKHADDDAASTIKKSLPGLAIGTAWVWSPSWLGVLTKVRVRKRRTFDSSATPKVGQRKVQPRAMADVDLDALGEQIAATREKAEANDPDALRRKVTDLQRQVLDLQRQVVEAHEQTPEPEQVEVPAVSDDLFEEFRGIAEDLTKALDRVAEPLALIHAQSHPRTLPPHAAVAAPAPPRPVAGGRGPMPRPLPSSPAGEPANLPKAQRAVLTVLAQYGPRTKTQTAILAGYAAGGGGFNNALGALRSAGYITGRDTLEATPEGVAALGEWEPLPTGRALVDHHAARLTKAAREVLDVLVDAYPTALGKEEIAAATPSRYAPTGGGFNNALGRLRSLELVVTEDGCTRAADSLMEAW